MTPDEVDHRAGCMNKGVFTSLNRALRAIDNMIWAGEIEKGMMLNAFRCTGHPGVRQAWHVGSSIRASRAKHGKQARLKRRKRRH
jgi:hypothetical protein